MPRVLVVVIAALLATGCATAGPPRPFNVVETGIPELRQALNDGRLTSRQLVLEYLTRIALYEDQLNASDDREPARRLPRPTRWTASARPASCAARCTASRSRSRTTSTRPTCRRRAARWPSRAIVPPYDATLTKNLRDGGRDHHRQDRAHRARQLGGRRADADAGQLQRAGRLRAATPTTRAAIRARPPSTGGRCCHRRLELRHRHRGELLGGQRRHRDVGLDPEPGEPEHAGRHQAHGRPHQPLRHHPDHRRPGHRGADGAHGDRRRDPVGVLEGARPIPNDPATRRVHAAAESRLHAVTSSATRSRARASASRARSTTTAITPPGERRRAAASTPEQAQGRWPKPSRCCKRAGRRDRRSRGHSERASSRIRRTTPVAGTSARGADARRAADAELLDRASSTA